MQFETVVQRTKLLMRAFNESIKDEASKSEEQIKKLALNFIDKVRNYGMLRTFQIRKTSLNNLESIYRRQH
jgi:restriction endonuclease